MAKKGKEFAELRNILHPCPLKHDAFLMSITGEFCIDILEQDAVFSRYDADYDDKEATYKGKPCSMAEYVKLKFGQKALDLSRIRLRPLPNRFGFGGGYSRSTASAFSSRCPSS